MDGKANEECIRFLAELGGVPRARVRIVHRRNRRTKLVEIEGIEQDALHAN